jgi:predicted nucleotidyltransferase component of viral defense system
MAKKLLHKDPTFKDLINIVASEMSINPYLVEKDYWIMHTLYGLQKQNFEFELKGGTSLSKGYKIIHRFSEDLDLKILPPKNMKVMTGKNHTKDAHVKKQII